MSTLDPIATSLDGIALIEASAGTGKTHTITTLVLRLVLERALDIRRVLVLTYTRAATAELRDRIRRRLAQMLAVLEPGASGGSAPSDDDLDRLAAQRRESRAADIEQLAQALRDFDEAPIFTIHGFCQRVLGENALESHTPFEVELLEDGSALVDEVAADLWERQTWNRTPAVLRGLLRAKVGLTPQDVRSIVDAVVREPSMPIVPELGQEPVVPDSLRFDAARSIAASIWQSDREDVLARLCSGALSGNSYSVKAIRERWAPLLDELATVWTSETRRRVAALTPDTLAGKTIIDKKSKGRQKHAAPAHPFFDACAELHAATEERDSVYEALALHVVGTIARDARKRIAQRKAERGVQGFEDLLERFANALRGDEGRVLATRIATRYPALLVDEFQDTDPTQYGVFDTLHQHGASTVLLIGDPKQAIYSFRGADVYAYANAAKRVGDRVLRLGVNYRSDPALVHAVNTLFLQSSDPFRIKQISYEAVQPRKDARERLTPTAASLQFLFVSRERAGTGDKRIQTTWSEPNVPKLIASEIVRLIGSPARLDGKPVVPADIAVLCRTNGQGRAMQAALSELGVPSAFDGDSSVFDSETAEELGRVLMAVARPGTRSLRSALATALLGFDAEQLIELETHDALHAFWLEQLTSAHKTWLERGFVQSIHGLLMAAGVHQRLLARRDGQRRLTDALHVIELLHSIATSEHLGPLALVRRLGALREHAKDVSGGISGESVQLRLESDEHAVRITTVHRSKGLQYPIVFCPYLWHARTRDSKSFAAFHDSDDGHRLKIDLGSPELSAHKDVAKEEERAEAVRLAYVALTRAQHRCYVVWGCFHSIDSSALGHLLHGSTASDSSESADKLSELSDDQLRAKLVELRGVSKGAIDVRDAQLDATRYSATTAAPAALRARTFARKLSVAERLTSFSRITRSVARTKHETLGEGSDRDAMEQGAVIASDGTAAVDPSASTASTARVPLHDFPAGASAGTLIHSVYEHIDFRCLDPAELPNAVASALGEAHLDQARHGEPLVRGIEASLRTPLEASEPSFTLSSVAPAARVNELEFMLELERGSQLTPNALAALLERTGSPALAPGYADRVRGLREGAAEGFLRGFIDLVMRRGEKFYVVDYKSNHLGATVAGYTQPRLIAEMQSHHYFLQAYLYTLALHRYLRTRLRDYDYDRHIGGYYYLFVRGMDGSDGHAGNVPGVYAERPSRALIEGLSSLLRGGQGA